MRKYLAVTLGILTAIGGFVDIGDFVTNGLVGARFGMSLAWVVVVGVIGIVVYAEMAGRVTAVSGRPTFDLVRERLGARMGIANLVASLFINLLTLVAEIAGMAVVIQLVIGLATVQATNDAVRQAARAASQGLSAGQAAADSLPDRMTVQSLSTFGPDHGVRITVQVPRIAPVVPQWTVTRTAVMP